MHAAGGLLCNVTTKLGYKELDTHSSVFAHDAGKKRREGAGFAKGVTMARKKAKVSFQ